MFESSYLYALGANLAWSSATVVYTIFSHRVSVLWMNAYKATVAMAVSGLVISLFMKWEIPGLDALALFLLSGLLGLNLADIFFLNAFKRIGPARTLMMFGFQPILLGLGAAAFLDQGFEQKHFFGMIFMLGCLFSVAIEKFRKEGHWELKGFLLSFAGLLLDGSGNLMTRHAFDITPGLNPLVGSFFRTLGAVVGFIVIAGFWKFDLVKKFKALTTKEKALVTAASCWGTFLSLWLWFTAIRTGHLASLASVALAGPFFGGVFEHLSEKRWPSLWFFSALLMFSLGFATLNGLIFAL